MGPAHSSLAIDKHDGRHNGSREHSVAQPPFELAAAGTDAGSDPKGRSSYGTVPGAEFPSFVYVSVLAAFGWIMLASWLTFARQMDADLSLGIAIVLGIVFFALPVIIRHEAVSFSHPKPETPREFLNTQVETATGPLTGSSAWLQVLIIPLSLALAATLIGAAFLLVR